MLLYAYIYMLNRALGAANQALRELQDDFTRTFVAYSEKTVALEEANDAIERLLGDLETARAERDRYRDAADAAGVLLV